MNVILKKYDSRVQKINGNVEKLRKECETSIKSYNREIQELEKAYGLGVIEDDGSADQIEFKIAELRTKISSAEKKMSVLQENADTLLRKEANEFARSYTAEMDKELNKLKKKKKQLYKLREDYINAVRKACSEAEPIRQFRNQAVSIIKQADYDLVNELNLRQEYDSGYRDPLPDIMWEGEFGVPLGAADMMAAQEQIARWSR